MSALPTNRQLTPNEKTQLARAGIPEERVLAYLESLPIEYLIGKVQFAGLQLEISPAALIPRVETEELVELVVNDILTYSNQRVTLLDVGTGSGALAIAISHHLATHNFQPSYQIVGIDISAAALQLATRNASTALSESLRTTVSFLQSDLLTKVPSEVIDATTHIVANLPYIPEEDMPFLDESVRAHEPHSALNGGKQGFELIARLLDSLPQRSVKTDSIWLEVDQTHTINFFEPWRNRYIVSLYQDQFGRNRFAHLQPKL